MVAAVVVVVVAVASSASLPLASLETPLRLILGKTLPIQNDIEQSSNTGRNAAVRRSSPLTFARLGPQRRIETPARMQSRLQAGEEGQQMATGREMDGRSLDSVLADQDHPSARIRPFNPIENQEIGRAAAIYRPIGSPGRQMIQSD